MMHLTPDQFRKGTIGVTPSPNPFFTPRPEKKRADYRSVEWNSSRVDRDKELNVQVLLRCRPLIDEEQKMNVSKVVSCNEHRREVTVMQSLANKQVDRVFTFDKVFGPKAQQRSIYDQSISPIVNDVLEGFNCTIFAYGQTGTGKTYTMEGGMRKKGTGELPSEAGVIPRAVRQIFDTLEGQNADYSMKVTFLELYNEEVTDLLASEDSPRSLEEKTKRPISLMEDGKGCVIVRGLEEMAVYSANEIYSLLEQGASKRRTADTLLNKRSSRSHSVFSITVYIKESSVGDEELIKCGKLNLVDLAGSENISRSGAREGRAKEAGEINKSLLTLGRVINALVEHSPHVPYRDSKLTRLLRDSLGGKTKTCIIATISPSAHSVEETLSTLDYAYRAKNIKNKPEANQKMSKTVLLKDLYAEIERLREDTRAAREKNGVYIPNDRYTQEEMEKKVKNEKIEQLENNIASCKKEVEKFRELYLSEQEKKLDIDCELKECKVDLENRKKLLLDLEEQHKLTLSVLKEKEITISKLHQSENSLISRAKELSSDLHCAAEDISSLFMRLDQKNQMAVENQNTVLTFGSQLDQSLKNLHRSILGSVSHQQQQIRCMEEHVSSFIARKQDATQAMESKVAKMMETFNVGIDNLNNLANSLQMNASSDIEQMQFKVVSQTMAVEMLIANLALEARKVIGNIQDSLNEQNKLLAFSARQQEEGLARGLLSAQVMSKATVDFANDLLIHASDVMTLLEETQAEKTRKIKHFEKIFKEEAAREEQQAVEQITAILANLTCNRSKMVAEESQRIHESNTQETQRLHKEMAYMKKVSQDTRKELMDYMINAENAFTEDLFSAAECSAVINDSLQECTNLVDHSRRQWENAESAIYQLNKNNIQEIESAVDANARSIHVLHEDFLSASSAVETDFSARVDDTFAAVHDSLEQDHDCKEKLDSMSSECIDQLRLLHENHGENVSNIRTHSEQCLAKEYKIDEQIGSTPKKRDINVPSLKSIEAMRMSLGQDYLRGEEDTSESKLKAKSQTDSVSPISRTPFADIN